MVNINEIIGNETERIWQGRAIDDKRVYISTPDARSVLARGIRHFVGSDAVWLDEYEQVADWLSDNKGKGLLCVGNCGRGKTVICQQVLPIIFQHWHRLIMNTTTAIELNNKFEEFKQYKIISIDDLGTESVANDFGTRRNFVQELIDEAERKQKLLILSTNLNEKELTEKYDTRTMDRLRSLTKVVIFSGQSLRK